MKPTPTPRAPAAGIRKVGLFVKNDAQAAAKAEEFTDWLKARQIALVSKTSTGGLRRSGAGPVQPPKDLFCLFVLGGDGTFLSAARWIGDRDSAPRAGSATAKSRSSASSSATSASWRRSPRKTCSRPPTGF